MLSAFGVEHPDGISKAARFAGPGDTLKVGQAASKVAGKVAAKLRPLGDDRKFQSFMKKPRKDRL